MKHVLTLIGLVVMCGVAEAAPGVVRLLQAPAWLERGGEREPLTVGRELAAGDAIRTGPGARVLLALDEGSLVKLGAEADFAMPELNAPNDAGGTFTGFIKVLRGAFRFTTTVVGRKRDIRAQVGAATIGIRGTDVWGKSEEARDFVVLLEGKIDIEREGQTYALETPLSLFMAPRGAAPQPIGPVNPDELALWAQETEPQPEAGIVNEQGGYRLNLASFADANAATGLKQRLADAGYAAQVEAVEVNGKQWQRVFSSGYATRADALAVAAQLKEKFALASPWVGSAL